MRGRDLLDPGPLRRWWWRSGQGKRLVAAGMGTAAGFVLLAGGLLGVPTNVPRGSGSLPPITVSDHVVSSTDTPASGDDPTSGSPVSVSGGPSKTTTSGPSSAATSTTDGASPTTTTTEVEPTTAGPPPPTTTDVPTTTTDVVQRGVRIGDPCSPEGATGITVDGQTVKCVGGGPKGQPKWRKP